ncbi:MAG: ASCH domain-containing protein [Salinibacterium sp.]|nr:ASCH domain-containing protein [Salinibacterium sp.]
MDDPTDSLLISPNSVLANALLRTIDMIRPRIAARAPRSITFVVGTQINGAPHLGTGIVQTAAFLLARAARRAFSIDTRVLFSALDNAPHDVIVDPESFHAYQKVYAHALGPQGVDELIDKHYRSFFESLFDLTDAEYSIETYTDQQADDVFRQTFVETVTRLDDIRWWLAPSHGTVHIRIPCPHCDWAEKRSERTKLVDIEGSQARFEAVCLDHGPYEASIGPGTGNYLDLSTLYRNLVKERVFAQDESTLYVMVKGGDWSFGCQLVDGAHAALGTDMRAIPPRIFSPMVLADTGAKLSKSLIREQHDAALPEGVEPWMLDTSRWSAGIDNYVDSLAWLVDAVMSDPKHFYRSFTTKELGRLMENRPNFGDQPRARDMAIYKKYFDQIATGDKTIEVRVGYSSMKRIKPGQLLRFVCRDESCLTKVIRVATYSTFEEMFTAEDPDAVNPGQDVTSQIQEIRRIFPRDKEALGVIAIEIEKV